MKYTMLLHCKDIHNLLLIKTCTQRRMYCQISVVPNSVCQMKFVLMKHNDCMSNYQHLLWFQKGATESIIIYYLKLLHVLMKIFEGIETSYKTVFLLKIVCSFPVYQDVFVNLIIYMYIYKFCF